MDGRRFSLSITLALATFLLIRMIMYRWMPVAPEELKAGQEVAIPSREDIQKPLMVAMPSDSIGDGVENRIDEYQTTVARWKIDTRTASLAQMTLLAQSDGRVTEDMDVYSFATYEPGRAMPLMLVFDQGTPVGYSRISEGRDAAGSQYACYRHDGALATIEKTFTWPDTGYYVDLNVVIQPKKDALIPCLMIEQPSHSQSGTQGACRLIFRNEVGDLIKNDVVHSYQKAFVQPTLFGLAGKYTLAMLVPGAAMTPFVRGYVTHLGGSDVALLQSAPIERAVNKSTNWSVRIYVGPQELYALESVDAQLTGILEYGMFGFLVKGLYIILLWLYSFLHNYGLAIIFLTILINVGLMPLSRRGERAMERMQDMQRRLQYLDQKYKHEPQRLAAARADLIAEHGGGIDALGCSTFVVQLLFFYALNKLLSSFIGLHHAPFFGWIQDLSSRDPYYILPLCIAGAVGAQALSSREPRQQFIALGVALVIGSLMANLAAGLALFIITNVLFRVSVSYIKQVVGNRAVGKRRA
jgi:YidC/Oxa1 family membrane protein insertase